MKSDTDDKVRVTVTLNRQSDPAWFTFIKSITSGRARAEILRRYLKPPPGAAASLHIPIEPTVAGAGQVPAWDQTEAVTQSTAVAATTPFAESRRSGKAETSTANPPKKKEASGVLEKKPAPAKRGGMAAAIMSSGKMGIDR